MSGLRCGSWRRRSTKRSHQHRFPGREPAIASSGLLCPLGGNIQCVERLAGRHKQAVFLDAAETKIRAGFRKMDSADECAIGREYVHSVEPLRTPSSRGPDVPVHIAANAV